MYHNTTESVGSELLEFAKKAKTQEDKVLKVMQILYAIRPEGWGASEVRNKMLGLGVLTARTPLTSIRRAITDLTSEGKLIKTDRQRPGPYGKAEFLYTLPKGQLRLVI